jgi:hypothetical protein
LMEITDGLQAIFCITKTHCQTQPKKGPPEGRSSSWCKVELNWWATSKQIHSFLKIICWVQFSNPKISTSLGRRGLSAAENKLQRLK